MEPTTSAQASVYRGRRSTAITIRVIVRRSAQQQLDCECQASPQQYEFAELEDRLNAGLMPNTLTAALCQPETFH